MKNIVYYQWGNSAQGPMLIMQYDGDKGTTKQKFIGYSLRDAYRKFKQMVGIKRARLEKVEWLFFGIF